MTSRQDRRDVGRSQGSRRGLAAGWNRMIRGLVGGVIGAIGLALLAGGSQAQTTVAGLADSLTGGMSVVTGNVPVPQPEALPACPLRYTLPGDIGLRLPTDSQAAFDKYSWQTFMALASPEVGQRLPRVGDTVPQWASWSSTVDVIRCNRNPRLCDCPNGDCSQPGSRYYPPECRAIPNYTDYRVLDQVSKVDDGFLQATHGGLSNSPLIDFRGNFLRFEIVVSPVTQSYVVENEFYRKPVLDNLTSEIVFPCGQARYKGGDPANERSGAIVVKNAWMELPIRSNNSPLMRQYHTEKLLLYTPDYHNSTGRPSCELKTMGLVGQHIAHKTIKQPRWTWSTFEHRNNAPDCTALPPDGDQDGTGPSTACPANVSRNYNFYPKSCSANGADPDACQTCNAAPVSNAPGCLNPSVSGDTSWCLDKPPAAELGVSKLCRQVPVSRYYRTASMQNRACAKAIGKRSVWSNYQLIGTQWYNEPSRTCQGASQTSRKLELPQVPIKGGGGDPTTPYLANTSMESDVRSNCMGCHSNPTVGKDGQISTDFMYWIELEAASGGSSSSAALEDFIARSPH